MVARQFIRSDRKDSENTYYIMESQISVVGQPIMELLSIFQMLDFKASTS